MWNEGSCTIENTLNKFSKHDDTVELVSVVDKYDRTAKQRSQGIIDEGFNWLDRRLYALQRSQVVTLPMIVHQC